MRISLQICSLYQFDRGWHQIIFARLNSHSDGSKRSTFPGGINKMNTKTNIFLIWHKICSSNPKNGLLPLLVFTGQALEPGSGHCALRGRRSDLYCVLLASFPHRRRKVVSEAMCGRTRVVVSNVRGHRPHGSIRRLSSLVMGRFRCEHEGY